MAGADATDVPIAKTGATGEAAGFPALPPGSLNVGHQFCGGELSGSDDVFICCSQLFDVAGACPLRADKLCSVSTPRKFLVLVLVASGGLAGCATPPGGPQQHPESVREGVARKVARVCALPEAEREKEIRRIREEIGVELQCAQNEAP